MKRALGVISGTSMDGIDVALVTTDGRNRVERRAGRVLPYDPVIRKKLLAFLEVPERAEWEPLLDLEAEITDMFIDAVKYYLADEELSITDIDLVGLHGQTIWHSPEKRFTRQLGSGAAMAKLLGCPVVDAFRQADVKAGGQGAPLVPLYHAALASRLEKPLIVLNLGGVANITYLDGKEIIACDTGPASALIDDRMLRLFGLPFDEGGRVAASGQVNEDMLGVLLADPFFSAAPPKSLDRQHFQRLAGIVDMLPPADVIATLTAFTIAATCKVLEQVPKAPRRWLVAGGGRKNAAMMAGFAQRLGVPVEPVETVGWDGDALEAECFGYLAVRTLNGLPLSLPTTTGAPRPMQGGVLHHP